MAQEHLLGTQEVLPQDANEGNLALRSLLAKAFKMSASLSTLTIHRLKGNTNKKLGKRPFSVIPDLQTVLVTDSPEAGGRGSQFHPPLPPLLPRVSAFSQRPAPGVEPPFWAAFPFATPHFARLQFTVEMGRWPSRKSNCRLLLPPSVGVSLCHPQSAAVSPTGRVPSWPLGARVQVPSALHQRTVSGR